MNCDEIMQKKINFFFRDWVNLCYVDNNRKKIGKKP